jgi:hypothetical protein
VPSRRALLEERLNPFGSVRLFHELIEVQTLDVLQGLVQCTADVAPCGGRREPERRR